MTKLSDFFRVGPVAFTRREVEAEPDDSYLVRCDTCEELTDYLTTLESNFCVCRRCLLDCDHLGYYHGRSRFSKED